MIPDRNKSELTHKVTQATWQWLDNHGFKPVETEVDMPISLEDPGWIADLAAVIHPTQTELVNMKMIPRRPSWSYREHRTEEWLQKRRAADEAWRAAESLLNRRMTCLVEVKTSRGDFTGDKKWKRTPPVDMALLAMVPGIARPEEWPAGWGVLELRGDGMVKLRNPEVRKCSVEQHLEVIYAIALRRDHRTRYEAVRQSQKEWRVEDAKRTSMNRISAVIEAVTDIVKGSSLGSPLRDVEQALARHGIRDVKERHLDLLRPMFGIAPQLVQPSEPYPSWYKNLSAPVPDEEMEVSSSSPASVE